MILSFLRAHWMIAFAFLLLVSSVTTSLNGQTAPSSRLLNRTSQDAEIVSHGGLELVENPADWHEANGWILYEGPSYGWIRSPQGSFLVDIRRRPGGSMAFVVGYTARGRDKITYRIGRDGWLSRKDTIAGKTTDSESSVRLIGEDYYRLLITIEPQRVTIRDFRKRLLDACALPDPDFTAAKFGFKGGHYIRIAKQ